MRGSSISRYADSHSNLVLEGNNDNQIYSNLEVNSKAMVQNMTY